MNSKVSLGLFLISFVCVNPYGITLSPAWAAKKDKQNIGAKRNGDHLEPYDGPLKKKSGPSRSMSFDWINTLQYSAEFEKRYEELRRQGELQTVLNTPNEKGNTPLHYLFTNRFCRLKLDSYIKDGANLELKNARGFVPIQLAVMAMKKPSRNVDRVFKLMEAMGVEKAAQYITPDFVREYGSGWAKKVFGLSEDNVVTRPSPDEPDYLSYLVGSVGNAGPKAIDTINRFLCNPDRHNSHEEFKKAILFTSFFLSSQFHPDSENSYLQLKEVIEWFLRNEMAKKPPVPYDRMRFFEGVQPLPVPTPMEITPPLLDFEKKLFDLEKELFSDGEPQRFSVEEYENATADLIEWMDTQPEATQSYLPLPVTTQAGPSTVAPVANSFKEEIHHRLPHPHNPAPAPAFQPSFINLFFKRVPPQTRRLSERHVQRAVKPYSVKTSQFEASCYTLSEDQPRPGERLTIILAGRGTEARIPTEAAGGRVVLLLSPSQQELSQSLVYHQIDTCLINSLVYFRKQLTPTELGYFTTRRIAAFELAEGLGWRGSIAVIDDNINQLKISSGLFQTQNLTWPGFYSQIDFVLKDTNASVIGLRENHYKEPSRFSSSQVALVGPLQTGKPAGFGQKIFFFQFEQVREAASMASAQPEFPKYENLFPSLINIPQEDLFFQLLLAHAGKKVFYIDREAIEFSRFDQHTESLAKEFIREHGVKAEEWLRRDWGYEKNKLRQGVIEDLQLLVRADLLNTEKYNQSLIEAPLVQRDFSEKPSSRSVTPNENSQRTTELETDDENALDKKPGSPKPELPRASTTSEAVVTPEMWMEFTKVLKTPTSGLRPHQVQAVLALSSEIESGGKVGYFPMATGTGKSFIIGEILKKALTNLRGSLILIAPNLRIQDQLEHELNQNFGIDLVSVSSRGTETAKLAAVKSALKKQAGEKPQVLVFCQDSFELFIRERKGDVSDISMVIVDESHKFKSHQARFFKSLVDLNRALILGFSATPRKKSQELFRKVIYGYTTEQGVKDGVLVPWETRTLNETEESVLQNLPEILAKEIHPEGESLKTRPGIIYIGRSSKTEKPTETAYQLAQVLNEAKIPAFAYHSKIKPDKLNQAIRDFKDGKIKVLIAINTLREGFDAPVDYVLLTKKKYRKYDIIQMRGRGLRPSKTPGRRKTALFLTIDGELADKFSMKPQEVAKDNKNISARVYNKKRQHSTLSQGI